MNFTTMDPLAEKNYSIPAYAYCMNNPINGIDNDGRLVLFINGFCINPIEMGQKSYWKEFADKTMDHLNEQHAMYIDGSLGSWLSDDLSIVSSKTRLLLSIQHISILIMKIL
ncbi:hypothetical protein [uncultured Bacteroides sp.]|uniref:hypothetical protein n=1 Tax=uncultured Bacteroides sp. TaxID=162156 RepID=UPI002AABF92A|nr:hypothetical protein [uncultured Bacteroides sp.]